MGPIIKVLDEEPRPRPQTTLRIGPICSVQTGGLVLHCEAERLSLVRERGILSRILDHLPKPAPHWLKAVEERRIRTRMSALVLLSDALWCVPHPRRRAVDRVEDVIETERFLARQTARRAHLKRISLSLEKDVSRPIGTPLLRGARIAGPETRQVRFRDSGQVRPFLGAIAREVPSSHRQLSGLSVA
jgi:hypothetical protein